MYAKNNKTYFFIIGVLVIAIIVLGAGCIYQRAERERAADEYSGRIRELERVTGDANSRIESASRAITDTVGGLGRIAEKLEINTRTQREYLERIREIANEVKRMEERLQNWDASGGGFIGNGGSDSSIQDD